jgi:hypothetical protein
MNETLSRRALSRNSVQHDTRAAGRYSLSLHALEHGNGFHALQPLLPSRAARSLSRKAVSGLYALCGEEVKRRENGLKHSDTDKRAG